MNGLPMNHINRHAVLAHILTEQISESDANAVPARFKGIKLEPHRAVTVVSSIVIFVGKKRSRNAIGKTLV